MTGQIGYVRDWNIDRLEVNGVPFVDLVFSYSTTEKVQARHRQIITEMVKALNDSQGMEIMENALLEFDNSKGFLT